MRTGSTIRRGSCGAVPPMRSNSSSTAVPAGSSVGCWMPVIRGWKAVAQTKSSKEATAMSVGQTRPAAAMACMRPHRSGVPFSFVDIALGRTLGVPNDILIMIAVLVVLWVLVNRTELGQSIQAIGGNAEAARLSGIRVHRVKILAYVISGLTAALTAILLASLLGSGTSSAADAYLLTAFAAGFLGSATLRDGEFHILGTFIAVLIISIGLTAWRFSARRPSFSICFRGSS